MTFTSDPGNEGCIMELEDYLEPEVGVAVAVTAAVTAALAAPPVRRVLRRGLVYGLAGLMMAGDRIRATAQAAAREAERATQPETPAPEQHATTPATT